MSLELEQICFGNCNFSFFEEEGSFFFKAKDLSDFLGYYKTVNMLKIVSQEIDETPLRKLTKLSTDGKMRESIFLSESQMYIVLFRSDKENAKPFRKWLSEDVLPSIRKKGIYQAKAEVLQIEAKLELLETKLKDAEENRELLRQRLRAQVEQFQLKIKNADEKYRQAKKLEVETITLLNRFAYFIRLPETIALYIAKMPPIKPYGNSPLAKAATEIKKMLGDNLSN